MQAVNDTHHLDQPEFVLNEKHVCVRSPDLPCLPVHAIVTARILKRESPNDRTDWQLSGLHRKMDFLSIRVTGMQVRASALDRNTQAVHQRVKVRRTAHQPPPD
jgi:hypothetical protein